MNKRMNTRAFLPIGICLIALFLCVVPALFAQQKTPPATTAPTKNPSRAAAQKPATAPRSSTAQQPVPADLRASIRVLAKSCGDSVVLRWGPTSNWAWTSLNRTGYMIERIDISEARHPKRQLLTPQPLKPLTLDQMKAAFDRNNKYAAIAAQCLYGKNFAVGLRKGQGGLEDKANVWKDRWAFAMDVADFDGQVAKAEAMRFIDTKVQKNGIYIYRVYPAQPTTGGKIDTGNTMIENTGLLPPGRPRVTELVALDRLAELHWPRIQQESYSGYSIERSADGRNFKPLTSLPYISSKPDSTTSKKDSLLAKVAALLKTQQIFVDSLPQNYHRYYYRIKGINAFAEWSNYSDTLSVMGTDLTAPAAPIVENPKFISGKKLLLRWKKPLKESDFKGFLVTRSHNAVAGPYTPLTQQVLSPSTTQFEDDSAFAHGQNFYIVLAIDTAGNTASSIPTMGLVPDNTPPVIPNGLKGFISRNGLVHLSWHANPDEDIKGYKVYFANGSEHIFTQITLKPTADTAFTDSITLHTLSKYIWYKIVAVDQNNNHSKYSEPLRLKKPDLVPPTAPLASRVLVDTGGVQIDWIQSSSDDVVSYIIYRKEKSGPWIALSRQQPDKEKSKFHFTDKGLRPFTNYSYCAEAVDEDSLHSGRSTAVQATVKTLPDLPPLKGLAAAYDDKTRQVRLSWQYQNTGDYFFVLYRSAGNNALTRFRSLNAQTTEFHDDQLPAAGPPSATGTTTTPGPTTAAGATTNLGYAIQVLFKDRRGRTQLSETVKVTIPSK